MIGQGKLNLLIVILTSFSFFVFIAVTPYSSPFSVVDNAKVVIPVGGGVTVGDIAELLGVLSAITAIWVLFLSREVRRGQRH